MAESYLDMIFRTKKEGAANKQMADELKGIQEQGKNAAGAFEMLTGSSLSAAGAFGALAGALKFSIEGAMESEKIQADLNATLISTKGAAGLSADQINRMAESLSEMSGIEDDSIVKAQAMLLTFTNIGKDVFPMASEAMVNMASKFGSVDQAAMQLGKALNDPIAGVGALRKVGVALTDEQEKQIKRFVELGDVASAQKVILGELQTEFGGLAQAMGNTTEGSINKLKNSLGNLAETVGGKLTPVLKEAADTLNLLLTADTKVQNAVKTHSQEVAETTATYEEYAREMVRVNAVTIGAASTNEVIDERVRRLGDDLEEVVVGWGNFSRAEWNAIQTERQQAAALEQVRAAMAANGPVMDEFSSKVGSTSLVTADFGRVLKDLEQDKISRLKLEFQGYTEQLLFNQAAAGLNADSSRKLAEAMGLISPITAIALTELDKLKAARAAGTISTDEYNAAVVRLNNNIAAAQSKTVTITVNTVYNGTPYGGAPNGANSSGQGNDPYTDPGTGSGFGGQPKPYTGENYTGKDVFGGNYGGGGEGYARGADFVVPPGYPNDSFPMRVESGEHVTVTPAGEQPARSGPVINLGGVVINNGMDLDLLVARLGRMTR